MVSITGSSLSSSLSSSRIQLTSKKIKPQIKLLRKSLSKVQHRLKVSELRKNIVIPRTAVKTLRLAGINSA